jgi:autophagy-related protein 101
MDHVEITIDEVEVGQEFTHEVTNCLLHTIVFHRAISMIKPTEQETLKLNIRFPIVNNEQIIQTIEEGCKEFVAIVDKSMEDMKKTPNTQRSIQSKIELSFMNKKSFVFEKWIIPLRIISMADYQNELLTKKMSIMTTDVIKRMKQILTRAQATTDHLPNTETDLTFGGCYPFQIILPDKRKNGWLNWLGF